MKRRILILTYYYPPDLSAGSFRSDALVKTLLAHGDDLEIDVITSMPNRYEGIASVSAATVEQHGKLKVTRIALPQQGVGRVSQAKRFIGFGWAAYRLASRQHYDLVFATSSRLMTAVLGAIISRKKKCLLYLDIRDIFAETMLDLSKSGVGKKILRILNVLERWTVSRADGINVVSGGFVPYFRKRYGNEIQIDVFTNGIDEAFVGDFSRNGSETRDIVEIVYAGNVGDGQGLHLIVPQLAVQLSGIARFRVVGDGGRMDALRSAVADAGLTNVILEKPVPRSELVEIYRQADVLFLHLNEITAFERVIPSKIFEYAATGKPILAGVSGFSAQFITEEISNAAVFSPCDVRGGLDALGALKLELNSRSEFKKKYQRSTIMSKLVGRLISMVRASK